MDLISRRAALDALNASMIFGRCNEKTVTFKALKKYAEGVRERIEALQALPSAQPERKRGKWEMLQMPISPPVYKCSVCGSHALQSMTGCLMNRHYEANLTNYCPNCGADMRGEQDDEP